MLLLCDPKTGDSRPKTRAIDEDTLLGQPLLPTAADAKKRREDANGAVVDFPPSRSLAEAATCCASCRRASWAPRAAARREGRGCRTVERKGGCDGEGVGGNEEQEKDKERKKKADRLRGRLQGVEVGDWRLWWWWWWWWWWRCVTPLPLHSGPVALGHCISNEKCDERTACARRGKMPCSVALCWGSGGGGGGGGGGGDRGAVFFLAWGISAGGLAFLSVLSVLPLVLFSVALANLPNAASREAGHKKGYAKQGIPRKEMLARRLLRRRPVRPPSTLSPALPLSPQPLGAQPFFPAHHPDFVLAQLNRRAMRASKREERGSDKERLATTTARGGWLSEDGMCENRQTPPPPKKQTFPHVAPPRKRRLRRCVMENLVAVHCSMQHAASSHASCNHARCSVWHRLCMHACSMQHAACSMQALQSFFVSFSFSCALVLASCAFVFSRRIRSFSRSFVVSASLCLAGRSDVEEGQRKEGPSTPASTAVPSQLFPCHCPLPCGLVWLTFCCEHGFGWSRGGWQIAESGTERAPKRKRRREEKEGRQGWKSGGHWMPSRLSPAAYRSAAKDRQPMPIREGRTRRGKTAGTDRGRRSAERAEARTAQERQVAARVGTSPSSIPSRPVVRSVGVFFGGHCCRRLVDAFVQRRHPLGGSLAVACSLGSLGEREREREKERPEMVRQWETTASSGLGDILARCLAR